MLLEVRDLELFYGDARALGGVTLDVSEGEVVAIIGANGAGKTSLINAIAGVLKPSRGQVSWQGRHIAAWPSYKVCNLGISQVPEGREVFPGLSVKENLLMGAMIPRARSRREHTLQEVLDLFPRLAERLQQPAGTLSGGEQQMLAIGRCLMARPKLIMFDEPSLGLAPKIVQELFVVIASLVRDRGITVLLVEQNVAASLKLADRAYVLENGEIALEGSASALLTDDRIRKAYLGL